MVEKIRHQLFLPKPVSDRFLVLAGKAGASRSAMLADALTAWLDRQGTSEFDNRFGLRLDRMSDALALIRRENYVLQETLALLARYELAVQAPLAENDNAGRAMAAKRFDAFVTQVARQVDAGRRTILTDGDAR